MSRPLLSLHCFLSRSIDLNRETSVYSTCQDTTLFTKREPISANFLRSIEAIWEDSYTVVACTFPCGVAWRWQRYLHARYEVMCHGLIHSDLNITEVTDNRVPSSPLLQAKMHALKPSQRKPETTTHVNVLNRSCRAF